MTPDKTTPERKVPPPEDPPDAHVDQLLDQALADSFPASDPVSTLTEDARKKVSKRKNA
jgi:hypothetical protein